MPEILTESFCERCGTRYTFESAAPKVRLKGLKVMSRGLRNFVMSDDTSMDEAMAAARNETEREQTTHQLDAFHKTFNFCMSCRQYTCGNCWNEADGRCLSCAPTFGQEIVPAPFGNVAAGGAMTISNDEAIGLQERNGHDTPAPAVEPMAWPTSDLMREAEAATEPPWAAASPAEPAWTEEPAEPEAGPAWTEAVADRGIEEIAAEFEGGPTGEEPSPSDDLEPFDFAARLEAFAGSSAMPELTPAEVDAQAEEHPAGPAATPEPEAPAPALEPVGTADATPEVVVDDRAAAAAVNTSDLLQRFRPGQNLDAEIEAYERAQATEAASTEPVAAPDVPPAAPEPTAPVSAVPEPIYPEPEPAPVETFAPTEPVVAPPEPEPEPVAATPGPEPTPEPRIDYVPQPTWQIVAPEAPTSEGVPAGPPVQQPTQPPPDTLAASGDPQWPSTPEWPDRTAAAGLPFLGRPAAATGGIDALWAASAQEVAQVGPAVATKGGVQPCVSCGLSLSATARFCRRCGTRQG